MAEHCEGTRIRKYDYLRSISCLFIVLLHVSGSYWTVVGRESSNWIAMTVYNASSRFAVPAFMMLSGAFLLETKKEPDIKGVLARFGKLLMNLYVWSAFFAFQGIAVKYILGGVPKNYGLIRGSVSFGGIIICGLCF